MRPSACWLASFDGKRRMLNIELRTSNSECLDLSGRSSFAARAAIPLLARFGDWSLELLWCLGFVDSTGRMKQAADCFGLGKAIIKFHRRFRFFDVIADSHLAQQLQCLWTSLQCQRHPAREHDDTTAIVDQFLHVRWLNSRHMMRAGLIPIPFASAAGIKFEVASVSEPFHFHPPPRNMRDPRRGFAFVFVLFHAGRYRFKQKIAKGAKSINSAPASPSAVPFQRPIINRTACHGSVFSSPASTPNSTTKPRPNAIVKISFLLLVLMLVIVSDLCRRCRRQLQRRARHWAARRSLARRR